MLSSLPSSGGILKVLGVRNMSLMTGIFLIY